MLIVSKICNDQINRFIYESDKCSLVNLSCRENSYILDFFFETLILI